MIKLAVAPDEAIGQMWVEILEQEGIRCLLRKTDPLSVAYGASAGAFSVDLLVDDEDAAQAREVLALDD